MANDPVFKTDPLGNEEDACCKGLLNGVAQFGSDLYNTFISDVRVVNTYVNPLTPVVELATGKSVESDFTQNKSRKVAAAETGLQLLPMGKIAGAAIKVGERMLVEEGEKVAEKTLVSLDNNILKDATERGRKADVLKLIGDKKPIVSITAAKEFLVAADKQVLKDFMTEIGATISKNGASAEQIKLLQQTAKSMGRAVRSRDASILAGAINNNAILFTRDDKLLKFTRALGLPTLNYIF
jgi:hypothetical protein